MNIRERITKFPRLYAITMGLAAVAGIASICVSGKAVASGPTSVEVFPQTRMIATIPSIGIVSRQMLRICIANPNLPEQDNGPVVAQVQLFDSQGNVLARSQEVNLPYRELRSFDFNRDELGAPGEPGTGRLQVRVEIAYWTIDPEQIPPEELPTSMELVDVSTGGTIQQNWYIGYVKVSPTG